MQGVTIQATAQRGRDVAASIEALRRALECTVRESTRLRAKKRTPPNGEGDGNCEQNWQRNSTNQQPFAQCNGDFATSAHDLPRTVG